MLVFLTRNIFGHVVNCLFDNIQTIIHSLAVLDQEKSFLGAYTTSELVLNSIPS